MKKIYFLSAMLILSASPIFSQVLFTYGTDAVSKADFLRAYNKNKSSKTPDEQSYKDYLDLYIKFKLKVKAAKALRLDTLQQLQADMDGFRTQVEEGYMNDEKGVNDLVKEAFLRSRKEIHTLHMFVPVNENMSATDSVKAHQLINAAYEQLNKGRTDYQELATELSIQHKMVIKAADMGFTTVLSVPYEYENIIYGLQPGRVAAPYRTKKAWHVFKNLDERRAMGKWRIAQILLLFPPNAGNETKQTIKHKADSIYKLLLADADFSELAHKFSEDKNTYQSGGELPEFTTGKFSTAFESAVFALKEDGDISAPIPTSFGYHIIKRIKHIPAIADEQDETNMVEIKQKVEQDARINIAKDKFLKDVLGKINYKRITSTTDAEVYRYADSVLKNKALVATPLNAKPLFSINGKIVTGKEWLNFAKEYTAANPGMQERSSKALFQQYIKTKAFEYYRTNLEKYNSDFKYQMQEFKEGNMLFEIMERNVWSKAANDSVGLLDYYKKNKAKYIWGESADVVIYNCGDLNAAEIAMKELSAGKNWKVIADESHAMIQADSGRYDISQLPDAIDLNARFSRPIVSNDGSTSFVQIISRHPAGEVRNFEEARGLVINDYQNYLEEKWIESLKNKYPVKINEAVLKTLR